MNKVLAQDEVDALLRGLTGGEIDTSKDDAEEEGDVVAFDLANQDRIIRGRMPVLEIVNDRFARLCTNALSNAVRKRVELNPISIDMTKFGEFIRSLPVPTSINIFKMDPLRGNAIMVVDSRLVFALVENIFGGSGSQPKIEGREFTRWRGARGAPWSGALNRPSWIISSSWRWKTWKNPGVPCTT